MALLLTIIIVHTNLYSISNKIDLLEKGVTGNIINIVMISKIKIDYFLIPTSNENNLIYLFITQIPEWEIKHSFCSSWVVCSSWVTLNFVF